MWGFGGSIERVRVKKEGRARRRVRDKVMLRLRNRVKDKVRGFWNRFKSVSERGFPKVVLMHHNNCYL